ncbi:MAG: hypothetical protein MJ200_04995 [Mycoplasmoidaceae bacterium]|nr:hypothetical protein [Mycoplasmoidaceae bacterium]
MLKIRYEDYRDKNINFDSFLCKDGCIVYKIIRKSEAKLFLEYVEEENYYVITCNKSITKQQVKEYVMANYEWVLN